MQPCCCLCRVSPRAARAAKLPGPHRRPTCAGPAPSRTRPHTRHIHTHATYVVRMHTPGPTRTRARAPRSLPPLPPSQSAAMAAAEAAASEPDGGSAPAASALGATFGLEAAAIAAVVRCLDGPSEQLQGVRLELKMSARPCRRVQLSCAGCSAPSLQAPHGARRALRVGRGVRPPSQATPRQRSPPGQRLAGGPAGRCQRGPAEGQGRRALLPAPRAALR
jgi:hypothetical protein